MNSPARRILLFLACAVVLLAAGFAWGWSYAHNDFYAPEATLDRELVHLDFNGRVLHFVNLGQAGECRRELTTRMRQQITYANTLLPDAPDIARQDAERRVQAAEQAMAGQTPVAAAGAPLSAADSGR